MTDLDQVRNFWENNPLFSGEPAYKPGTEAFFKEHRSVYITDCFIGDIDVRFLTPHPDVTVRK